MGKELISQSPKCAYFFGNAFFESKNNISTLLLENQHFNIENNLFKEVNERFTNKL